jgi:L-rhamnose mutarotase
MEALAWLLGLPSWREAIQVAEKYMRLSSTEQQAAKMRSSCRPPSMGEVRVWQELLHDPDVCGDRREWLYRRGINDQSIVSSYLGHNGAAFTIPVFDQHMNLVTVRFRYDDEIGGHDEVYDQDGEVIERRKVSKYSGWKGGNNTILYPAWRFARNRDDYAVVVEGELDAVRLWQEGIPAVTMTNGAGQQHQILETLDEFFQGLSDKFRRPPLRKLVVCLDRDKPGRDAARKLFQAARERYEEVVWVQWHPAGGKDITVFLARTGLKFVDMLDRFGFQHEEYVDLDEKGF